jgi:hypothetical protein
LAVIGLIWLGRTLFRAGGMLGHSNQANGDSSSESRNTLTDVSTEAVVGHACHATMALGMAVMFVQLV